MIENFAAFILTHGRPSKVYTYNTIIKAGYTGKIYIIIDNEDETINEYKKIYGDKVIVFDKKAISKTFDEADNFNDRRSIVYARNASFNIAKEIGVKYFIQLDDDYTAFNYKYNDRLEYIEKKIKNLDFIFSILLDYYKSINAKSIAMAQGGDFIGGKNSQLAKRPKMKRKCMNTFFCSTERPFKFLGRINEDVNTYTNSASKGFLFLTIPNVEIKQKTTQSNSGGMTDIYIDNGTYIKSFYTILFSPSCTKIRVMGGKNKRLHHSIRWKNAVPVIINESYKK